MNRSSRRILIKIYRRLYAHFGPQGWWPGDTAFEVIIGAILTQNTAWSNVEKAIGNLKRARALSPRSMRRLDRATLARLITPAGYYNVKAGRVKNFIDFLSSEYGLDLKRLSREATYRLRERLLGLNGIGPETCDSILLYAFARPVFVIDAYTKRVFSRHGFLKAEAAYEEFQAFFMNNLPRSARLFNEYHALIVRLAKEFCRTKPDCASCPLRTVKRINCLANRFG